MLKYSVAGVVALILSMPVAMAGEYEDSRCRGRDQDCEVKTKEVCFNLVCFYESKKLSDDRDDWGFKKCKVASTFKKKVTLDGGEVEDDSYHENNPQLEVDCDGQRIFNNSARRFTDLLGTRIQGETGPFPAISLPRGALHGNFPHDSGYHVSPSVLEVEGDKHKERLKGKCHIWTGAP